MPDNCRSLMRAEHRKYVFAHCCTTHTKKWLLTVLKAFLTQRACNGNTQNV